MNRSEIAAIIRERALANGVDPNVLLRTAQIESGLNPNAANSRSSAKGLFQFVDKTWGQYGNGGNPLDPAANADAGARFTAANSKALTDAGLQPTPGNIYLSHFLGPAGAAKLLNADPSASAASVVGEAAVKANPFLGRMSVSDLRGWAGNRMGPTSLDGAPPPRPPMPIPNVPETPQAVAAQGPEGGLLGAMGGAPSPTGGALGLLSQPAAAPAGSLGMPFRPPRPQMMGQDEAPQAGAPLSLDPQQAGNDGMLSSLIRQILQSHAGGGQLDEARQRPLG